MKVSNIYFKFIGLFILIFSQFIYSNANAADNVRRGYYDSGKLKFECPLVNGKLHGVCKSYYESGALMQESMFKNDKEEGVRKGYYENGALKFEISIKNDKKEGVGKQYHKNGGLTQEMTFKNDKANGLTIIYADDGSGALCMSLTKKDDKTISAKKRNGKPLNNAELSNLAKGIGVNCE